jgi:hypothetical protein
MHPQKCLTFGVHIISLDHNIYYRAYKYESILKDKQCPTAPDMMRWDMIVFVSIDTFGFDRDLSSLFFF